VIKLPLHTVSIPVRTVFGWHIILVDDTKTSDLAKDKEKLDIKSELFKNKSAIMYAQWLRDIRNSAYVKIYSDDN
jgi:peptidyl-prolyl cis-trans isomerase SurA